MKKIIKTFVIMITFISSMFFMTSCFGGDLTGKTYEVVNAEVKSNSISQDQLDVYNYHMSAEVGKTLIFGEDGDFAEESTLKSINGIQSLNTWSQNGNEIIINGGNNLYPTEAEIDGDQIIIKVGNISGMQFVYTLEEAK